MKKKHTKIRYGDRENSFLFSVNDTGEWDQIEVFWIY